MKVLLLALAASCWGQSTPKPVAVGEIFPRIDDYLQRLVPFGYAGTALVATDDRVLVAKGYGMADRARGIPMSPETVISIGSITKQFTGAAILKLEMQGKLRVEDTLSSHFADVPPDKATITLHQLLTHTAGLEPDYGPTDYEKVAREEYVERVLGRPLASKPGERFRYSNAGYSVLAAIVEKVSGQGYDEFLQEHLFGPAKMTRTGYKRAGWSRDEVAVGYRGEETWGTILERIAVEGAPYWNLRGNGGIHSTPGDMYRWHLALAGDVVLSKQAREKFQKGYAQEGRQADTHYAYGWSVGTGPHGRLVEHNGGNGIFAADFLRYLDAGLVIYVASTDSAISATQFSHRLARIAFGEEVPFPPKTVALEVAALRKHEGAWRLDSGSLIHVRAAARGLELAAEGRDAFALLAVPPRDSQRAETLMARAAAIFEAGAKGDYAPFREALGSGPPAEEVNQRQASLWAERRRRFGEFRKVEVLGAQSRGPGLATVARMDFERGQEYVQLLWGPGGLMGIILMEKPPGNLYLPESADSFVSFQLAAGIVSRVRFDGGRLRIGEAVAQRAE